jgi:hypothetical protein
MLVLLCVWHSLIASFVFLNPAIASKTIAPTNIYVIIDRYVFIAMFVTYIIIHIALIIWLILVPYKRRREMEYLDREYAAKKHIRLETNRPRYGPVQPPSVDLSFRRTSSIHGVSPTMKSPARMTKNQDSTTIIPNGSSFLPIKEETSDRMGDTLHVVDIHEPDDVFYDHTNDINNELKNTRIQPIQNA